MPNLSQRETRLKRPVQVRHREVFMHEDAIERARRRPQFVHVRCLVDVVEECVDDLVLDAAEVVRALLVGGGAPECGLQVGGIRQCPVLHLDVDHVEIERLEPLGVDREIDEAGIQFDAEQREVVLKDGLASTQGVAGFEPLELERLAFGVAQHAIGADFPARLLEQAAGLFQIVAQPVDVAGRYGLSCHAGPNTAGRQVGTKGFEQAQAPPAMAGPAAAKSEFANKLFCPLVFLVDVDRGEVVGKIQRFAHAAILEQRLAQVEDVRLVPHAEAARKLTP